MTSEIFEIFDAENQLSGTAPRQTVHREGLYHRAVHILLFTSKGELLVQKRAPDKDVCPNRWDLSVAEHHKPGETGLAAARRGLEEELGVSPSGMPELSLWREARLERFEAPQLKILDQEFVETYIGTYDGPVHPDGVEVTATALWTREEALARLEQEPATLTPWFQRELGYLNQKKTAW